MHEFYFIRGIREIWIDQDDSEKYFFLAFAKKYDGKYGIYTYEYNFKSKSTSRNHAYYYNY